MDNKEVIQLFLDKLNYKVKSIKDSTKGVDQEVKIVDTNKGIFVVKKPHKSKNKIKREVIATTHCARVGIPVPRVVYYDKTGLIETYIDGEEPGETSVTKKQYEKIYYQLGKILRKIHSTPCEGFGPIDTLVLRGKYDTQKAYIESEMLRGLKDLRNTNYYTQSQFNHITRYYIENKHHLDTKESVLLHSDFEEGNVLVKKGKVVAIIDFGDLRAGPAMQDLARLYAFHDEYKLKEFFRGYGAHNTSEAQFYSFCFMTWWIASHVKKNQKSKRFKIATSRYKALWDMKQ